MTHFPAPTVRFALLTASLVAITACNSANKPITPASEGGDAAASTAASDGKTALTIAGLPTEKEQVSYAIGMDIGRALQQVKDDVDPEVVFKAVRDSMAGGKLLMTPEQAMQVQQQFGQRMQAKQMEAAQKKARDNEAAGKTFLAANAGKPGVKTTASGLQYQVLSEGKGPRPTLQDTVRVHYKGTLLNGETFDSSYDRGEPVEFPLAGVVPGWSEGVQLMPVGSKYKLWIPGNLGYGETPPPGAPLGPNETLVFEVELIDIVKPPQG